MDEIFREMIGPMIEEAERRMLLNMVTVVMGDGGKFVAAFLEHIMDNGVKPKLIWEAFYHAKETQESNENEEEDGEEY